MVLNNMINDFVLHVWTTSCADKQHSIEKKESEIFC